MVPYSCAWRYETDPEHAGPIDAFLRNHLQIRLPGMSLQRTSTRRRDSTPNCWKKRSRRIFTVRSGDPSRLGMPVDPNRPTHVTGTCAIGARESRPRPAVTPSRSRSQGPSACTPSIPGRSKHLLRRWSGRSVGNLRVARTSAASQPCQKLHIRARQGLLTLGPRAPIRPSRPQRLNPHAASDTRRTLKAPQRHKLEQAGLQRVVTRSRTPAARADRPAVAPRGNISTNSAVSPPIRSGSHCSVDQGPFHFCTRSVAPSLHPGLVSPATDLFGA